jgi:CheY-like chemotaxis protein
MRKSIILLSGLFLTMTMQAQDRPQPKPGPAPTINIKKPVSFTLPNGLKVLVVEDIPLNQLLMKTLLDDFGFQRDIASNGKVAIEKLKTNSYDVILMDLQMPEMNGFEATEYIRNEMKLTIPIIALTADVTTMDLEKCTHVGMNDYIAKPVDERLLYSKIINIVKKIKNIQRNIQRSILKRMILL